MTCVFCCRTKASSKNLGITFHSFPKDNEMRKAWVETCLSRGCVLDENMKSIKLCSVHFTFNDYEENNQVRTFLKKSVVPSRFWRKPYMHCLVCSAIGSANCDVYLHEFPEDSNVRKRWISACRENGSNIQLVLQQHRICSKHFSSQCYTTNDKQRPHLKLDAVPHIFSLPTIAENLIARTEFVDVNACSMLPPNDILANSAGSAVECESIKSHPCTEQSIANASPESTAKTRIWRPARAGDFREEHFSSPRRAIRNFHVLSGICKEYRSKVALYRTKTWRLQRKVKRLESLLAQLTDK
ncbi:hypothetical protein CBL_03289 [Carabus blaptoides fortunei]